jgi:hypothetical protein
MSFHRVRNYKELDNLINNIIKNKKVLSGAVLDHVVDKEFTSQENAAAAKPTTDAIAGVANAVMEGLYAKDPAGKQVNRLDSIINNLFDKNTNESIISLLQQIKPIVDTTGADIGQVLATIESLKSGSNRRQDDIISELKKLPAETAKQIVSQNLVQTTINTNTADILTQLGQMLRALPSTPGSALPSPAQLSPAKTPVAATPQTPSFSTPSSGMPKSPYAGPSSSSSRYDASATIGPVDDTSQPVALPPGFDPTSSSSSATSSQHSSDAENAAKLSELNAEKGEPIDTSGALAMGTVRAITKTISDLADDKAANYNDIETKIKDLLVGDWSSQKLPQLDTGRYDLLVKLIQHPSRTSGKASKATNKTSEIQPDGALGDGKVDFGQLKNGKLVVTKDGKTVTDYSGGRFPLVMQILTVPERRKNYGNDLPDDIAALTVAARVLGNVVKNPATASGKYKDIIKRTSELLKDVNKDIDNQERKDAEKLLEEDKKGMGLKVPAKSYKMAANGKFGAISIDPANLQRMILTAHKHGSRICHQPCDYDLVELLTKRFNPKKQYSEKSRELFAKLAKHAELPVANGGGKIMLMRPEVAEKPPKSRKSRAKPADSAAIRVYSDPEEVSQRLYVLIGERSAGNKSPEVSNEISQLIDWLWNHDHISEEDVKSLAHAGGLLG